MADFLSHLPSLTEKEFAENISDDNFPLKFGNPAIINADNGKRYAIITTELYDRIAEMCGFPTTAEVLNKERAKNGQNEECVTEQDKSTQG